MSATSLPSFIGIVGKKQHGKSTIAAALAERGYTVDALAAPIKEACRDWFWLTDDQVDGSLKEVLDSDWERTPRQIMQLLGTEVARTIHPDVWARNAVRRHHIRGGRTVISDVRFLNEAEILRANGAVLIYVVRPDVEDNAFSRHASETQIESIGQNHARIQILNDGSLEDLHAKLEAKLFPLLEHMATHESAGLELQGQSAQGLGFDPQAFARSWSQVQAAVHGNAQRKGFWSDFEHIASVLESSDQTTEEHLEAFHAMVHAQKLKLMGDEIAEAHEGIRSRNPASVKAKGFSSVEEELADVVIRIMDYAAAFGLDISGAIAAKAAYNLGRPYKHGRVS